MTSARLGDTPHAAFFISYFCIWLREPDLAFGEQILISADEA